MTGKVADGGGRRCAAGWRAVNLNCQAVGDGGGAPQYLASYVFKVAIAERRILGVDERSALAELLSRLSPIPYAAYRRGGPSILTPPQVSWGVLYYPLASVEFPCGSRRASRPALALPVPRP